MNVRELGAVLNRLRPGNQAELAQAIGQNATIRVWLSQDGKVPTEAELAQEYIRYQADVAVEVVYQKRAVEYPPLESVIDAVDKALIGEKVEWNALVVRMDAIKAKYPLPGESP